MNLTPNINTKWVFYLDTILFGINSKFFVQVLLKIPNTICGGSIISSNLVLTAAHCFYEYNNESLLLDLMILESVQIGFGNRIKDNLSFINISKIYIHDNYNTSSMDNDIAVIEINAEEKSLDDFKIDISNVPISDNASCTISGWGKVENCLIQRNSASTLMTADITVMDSDCGTYKKLICADSQKDQKNSCLGDSGGPLVCDGKLHGIVSGQDDVLPISYYTNAVKYDVFNNYTNWQLIYSSSSSLTSPSSSRRADSLQGLFYSINVVLLLLLSFKIII